LRATIQSTREYTLLPHDQWIMTQTTAQWIATNEDLQACCSQLEEARYIALDTEFERVRTYYPRLCLIQLATAQGIWLLDPLQLGKLEPLKIVLEQTDTLIIHSARQDMEVLDAALNISPAALFDTQVAAAFLGLGEQAGYATLVQQTREIELEKSQTRTNWCQRPLTAAQLQYAADDVRYLGPLHQWLQQELTQQGKSAWMQSEMQDILTQRNWLQDPQSTALRLLAKYSRLDQEAQERFVVLAVWREKIAMQRNLPREWVLGNGILKLLAEKNPASLEQLQELDILSSKLLNRHGKSLLTALQSPATAPIKQKNSELVDDRTLQKKLQTAIREAAIQHNLSPGLLASRKTLLDLLTNEPNCPLSHGWRKQLIGEQLQKIIAIYHPDHQSTITQKSVRE